MVMVLSVQQSQNFNNKSECQLKVNQNKKTHHQTKNFDTEVIADEWGKNMAQVTPLELQLKHLCQQQST